MPRSLHAVSDPLGLAVSHAYLRREYDILLELCADLINEWNGGDDEDCLAAVAAFEAIEAYVLTHHPAWQS